MGQSSHIIYIYNIYIYTYLFIYIYIYIIFIKYVKLLIYMHSIKSWGSASGLLRIHQLSGSRLPLWILVQAAQNIVEVKGLVVKMMWVETFESLRPPGSGNQTGQSWQWNIPSFYR